jgi:hypothetical protein
MGTSNQMLDQSGIGGGTNPSEQDEVKIVLVRSDLEVIAWRNPSAGSYGFWYYKLAALAHVRRHWV